MGRNDGPDLSRHLAHFVLDASEHMLAAISGGAGQPLRDAARAAEERGNSQAGEAECAMGIAKRESFLPRSISDCLPGLSGGHSSQRIGSTSTMLVTSSG